MKSTSLPNIPSTKLLISVSACFFVCRVTSRHVKVLEEAIAGPAGGLLSLQPNEVTDTFAEKYLVEADRHRSSKSTRESVRKFPGFYKSHRTKGVIV